MPENIEKHPDVKHGDEMLRQYRREGHMLRRFTEFTNSIVAAAYEGQKALLDRSPEALTRLFGVRDAVVYTPDAMRRRLPLDGLRQSSRHISRGAIPEYARRLVDGRAEAVLSVPLPSFDVPDVGGVASGLVDPARHVDDPCLPAGGQIERLAERFLERPRPEQETKNAPEDAPESQVASR